uniref:AP2/ERF domain-containing protein n=1 Tax=Chromera velia CCMP2878 TaxID=1169474 RepID=A0A0G4HU82_9ALVE|eukprot:Cvel_8566.t1-p1 / transcript=Cvel_8566.t1 / gene=Cvel_8566 / organism=Chromera_velia_CCMP2878 / gene_product=hypothetical protein / transcript_product=hypothetical protein / location=Cvel_scaffold475:49190-56444(+) / protein_length=1153 / sequence_SO=supercontig / SO=protein_coding / is_pseudo=false
MSAYNRKGAKVLTFKGPEPGCRLPPLRLFRTKSPGPCSFSEKFQTGRHAIFGVPGAFVPEMGDAHSRRYESLINKMKKEELSATGRALRAKEEKRRLREQAERRARKERDLDAACEAERSARIASLMQTETEQDHGTENDGQTTAEREATTLTDTKNATAFLKGGSGGDSDSPCFSSPFSSLPINSSTCPSSFTPSSTSSSAPSASVKHTQTQQQPEEQQLQGKMKAEENEEGGCAGKIQQTISSAEEDTAADIKKERGGDGDEEMIVKEMESGGDGEESKELRNEYEKETDEMETEDDPELVDLGRPRMDFHLIVIDSVPVVRLWQRVMESSQQRQMEAEVEVIADPNASVAKWLGVARDMSKTDLGGIRCLPFFLLVEDGSLQTFETDEDPLGGDPWPLPMNTPAVGYSSVGPRGGSRFEVKVPVSLLFGEVNPSLLAAQHRQELRQGAAGGGFVGGRRGERQAIGEAEEEEEEEEGVEDREVEAEREWKEGLYRDRNGMAPPESSGGGELVKGMVVGPSSSGGHAVLSAWGVRKRRVSGCGGSTHLKANVVGGSLYTLGGVCGEEGETAERELRRKRARGSEAEVQPEPLSVPVRDRDAAHEAEKATLKRGRGLPRVSLQIDTEMLRLEGNGETQDVKGDRQRAGARTSESLRGASIRHSFSPSLSAPAAAASAASVGLGVSPAMGAGGLSVGGLSGISPAGFLRRSPGGMSAMSLSHSHCSVSVGSVSDGERDREDGAGVGGHGRGRGRGMMPMGGEPEEGRRVRAHKAAEIVLEGLETSTNSGLTGVSYTAQNGGTWMTAFVRSDRNVGKVQTSRKFRVREHGFTEAKRLAIQFRLVHHNPFERYTKERNAVNAGIKGVYFHKSSKCWRASWKQQGRGISKDFKVSEFGFDGAKERAIEFRKTNGPSIQMECGRLTRRDVRVWEALAESDDDVPFTRSDVESDASDVFRKITKRSREAVGRREEGERAAGGGETSQGVSVDVPVLDSISDGGGSEQGGRRVLRSHSRSPSSSRAPPTAAVGVGGPDGRAGDESRGRGLRSLSREALTGLGRERRTDTEQMSEVSAANGLSSISSKSLSVSRAPVGRRGVREERREPGCGSVSVGEGVESPSGVNGGDAGMLSPLSDEEDEGEEEHGEGTGRAEMEIDG